MISDFDTERNLDFMEAIHEMKSAFYRSVVSSSQTADSSALHALRQEPLYQLAEFLFSIHANTVVSSGQLLQLAQLHNEHLLGLRAEPARMRTFGLTPERLESALFTQDNLAKLASNFETGRAIDQSDLARFLVTVMSPETCRKVLVAAENGGFLERQRSPYGAMLVRSTGMLETILGDVLRKARHHVSPPN